MQSGIGLRPLRKTDVKSYYQIVREPSVAKGASFPLVKTLRQAQKMLTTDLGSGHNLAIVLNQQLIGVINLYPTIGKNGVPDDYHLELGYFMHPNDQGHGYMTRAIKLVVNQAENSAQITKLVADVSEDNVASIKVLKRNGFASYHSVLDLTQDHENLIFERPV